MSRQCATMLLMLCGATPLAAQSSVFGVRGLGQPGRSLSVAALSMEGAQSHFDGRSATNPASLGLLTGTALAFTSTQVWRSVETDAGDGSTREHRFPHFQIGGPIPGSSLAAALSFSSYAARDFTMVSTGVASPRDVPVPFTDSVGSTGGINDLRAAFALSVGERLSIGAGAHLITGSNRVFSVRAWEDESYLPIRQRAEIAYTGFGVSAGIVYRATDRMHLGASIRRDGTLDMQRDSVATTSMDLPLTLSGGVRYRVGDRIALAGQVVSRSWSRADEGIKAQGGVGAMNTLDLSGGLEWIRNIRRPEHLPLRLGIRRADLPFLLDEAGQPSEIGVAIGTGFRFAGDQGGIDLTLERVSRSQGDTFSESAFQFSLGVSLRGLLTRR